MRTRSVAVVLAVGLLAAGCASGPFDLGPGPADDGRAARVEGMATPGPNPLGCRAPSVERLVEDAAERGVRVDEGVLMAQGSPYCEREGEVATGWEGDPSFLVLPEQRGAAARRRAVAAVDATARRLRWVDQETGKRFEPWEEGVKLSPGYVSGPVVHDDGAVALRLDTDGSFGPALGRAVVSMLVRDLEERDVEAALGVPPPTRSAADGRILWDEAEPEPEESPAAGPVRWYLLRSVRTTTTDGRRYQDVDYWSERGTWTSRREDALTFAEGERAAATRLTERLRRRAAPTDVLGEPTAVLLGRGRDPWPQPPASLQRDR